MGEDQDERFSGLSEEEFEMMIRQCDLEISDVCIKAGAAAGATVWMLDNIVLHVADIAEALHGVPMPWAAGGAEQLLNACQQARLTRRDREGRILLSLPKHGDDVVQWLHHMRLVDDNFDLLGNAAKYAVGKYAGLRAVSAEVAARLSEIDHPEAQYFAARLRVLATEPVSKWATI